MFQCLPSVGSDPTVPGPPGVTQQVTTWGQIRQRIRELDIEILLLRLTSCGLWAKGWHPPTSLACCASASPSVKK